VRSQASGLTDLVNPFFLFMAIFFKQGFKIKRNFLAKIVVFTLVLTVFL
jgi:hypothetical protein